jgi:uncharacterized protein
MVESIRSQFPESTASFASFQEELAASFSNQVLHLILLPTEHCNFRCTYCYEDFSIGRMTPEIIDSIKRLIDRRLDGLKHFLVRGRANAGSSRD